MNLALLLLATIPYGEPIADSVSAIEHNVVYCDQSGNEVLRQFIYWDFYPHLERSHVIAWRLAKDIPRPVQVWPSREYEQLFFDGDVIRRIRARTFHDSHSMYDREVFEREDRSKESRRELFHPQPK